MEPIISPWIFYWIDVLGALKIATAIATTIAITGAIFSPMFIMDFYDDEELPKKAIKLCVILAISFIVMGIFIPSKDTMYKMLITSYITPNNIEILGGSLENALDKVNSKIIESQKAAGDNK